MALLPDGVWRLSAALHESAHALLSWVIDLREARVVLAKDRRSLTGGLTTASGNADVQLWSAMWLSAGYVQADWLKRQGYIHPELLYCVLEMGASGDSQVVDSYVADGYVLDRDQAISDALQVLALPSAAAALSTLAGELLR
ncbi:hypothetical protein [Streptomyces sp. 769]|uniref:hypothetical protein n=1 Tax=Streptomyces sp. 769 TaxID=1262452 RepID=UPI00057CA2E0|nr:hypothetical protein [Streptomyces sp. 769]